MDDNTFEVKREFVVISNHTFQIGQQNIKKWCKLLSQDQKLLPVQVFIEVQDIGCAKMILCNIWGASSYNSQNRSCNIM